MMIWHCIFAYLSSANIKHYDKGQLKCQEEGDYNMQQGTKAIQFQKYPN